MKIFELPDVEFHTEGDNYKEDYNLKRLSGELKKDLIFKDRVFDNCWKWGLDNAIIHSIKYSNSLEDAMDKLEDEGNSIWTDPKKNLYGIKIQKNSLAELNSLFDLAIDPYMQESEKHEICAMLEWEKGPKPFKNESKFEFTELMGSEGEAYVSRLTTRMKSYLDNDYAIVEECFGNNGGEVTDDLSGVDEIDSRKLSEELNWHNFTTSPQCKHPVVFLPNGQVFKGEQVIKDIESDYTRVAFFTYI